MNKQDTQIEYGLALIGLLCFILGIVSIVWSIFSLRWIRLVSGILLLLITAWIENTLD